MKQKYILLLSLLFAQSAFSQSTEADTTNTHGDRIDTPTETSAFLSKLAGGTSISAAELGYLDGLGGNVQSLLNGKLSLGGGILTGNLDSNADIFTSNTGASIHTVDDGSSIFTQGQESDIVTTGDLSTIYTTGSGSHIFTSNAGSHIQSRSTFKLFDGSFTTTFSHAPTANRAIGAPDADGTLALTTDPLGGIYSIDIQDATSDGDANIGQLLKTDANGNINITSLSVTNITGLNGAGAPNFPNGVDTAFLTGYKTNGGAAYFPLGANTEPGQGFTTDGGAAFFPAGADMGGFDIINVDEIIAAMGSFSGDVSTAGSVGAPNAYFDVISGNSGGNPPDFSNGLKTSMAAPAALDAGEAGQMIFTDTFTYRCFASGDWRRTAVVYTTY